jgi:tetratricopeptide (TPR) repeat protein
MAALLVITLLLLFLLTAYIPRSRTAWRLTLEPGSGETQAEALIGAGVGILLFGTWPLLTILLLRVLRWPQLLRAAGLAVLALTTGRVLALWLGHVLAYLNSRASLGESKLWILCDPGDWAIVVAGVFVWGWSSRLASDAWQMLPTEPAPPRLSRRAVARGLLVGSVPYALLVMGSAGKERYDASAHVLLPGVDPRREHEGALAQKEGWKLLRTGKLTEAEQSLLQALRIWEELADRGPSPSLYRANEAFTLGHLGWLHQQQGRSEQAEADYTQALALADSLAGDPQNDKEFQDAMAGVRKDLSTIRSARTSAVLGEKDRTAIRKYEEAEIKAQKGEPEAEHLFVEAIGIWEELIGQADNDAYRGRTFGLLASACIQLAELQELLGKRPAAEASFRKGIEHGEKAVAAAPDRPLPRHTIDVAREGLETLHAQEFQDRADRLFASGQFADAAALFRHTIESDERLMSSIVERDRDLARRRLASRMDRFAYFLAFCPDRRLRSLPEAVEKARRATELQPAMKGYWHTLCLVRYRNGKYQDCLASVEKMKAMEGGPGASALFLSAMALHRLKRDGEAREAYRQGIRWVEEKQRQAEGDEAVRFQLETVLPAIEALRREAEAVLEGRPSTDRDLS